MWQKHLQTLEEQETERLQASVKKVKEKKEVLYKASNKAFLGYIAAHKTSPDYDEMKKLLKFYEEAEKAFYKSSQFGLRPRPRVSSFAANILLIIIPSVPLSKRSSHSSFP